MKLFKFITDWWNYNPVSLHSDVGLSALQELVEQRYPDLDVEDSLLIFDAMKLIAAHIGFREIKGDGLIADDINEMIEFIKLDTNN